MKKRITLGALFLGMGLLFGCASQNNGAITADNSETGPMYLPVKKEVIAENHPATTHAVVKKAKSAIGTPYVLGGSAPGGFDCSGLVKWAYNSLGVELPRTAREQATVGRKVKNVKDMRAGDIVAFRHPKRGYHTGIYLGDGKFVHSPRTRSHVRINSLSDPYFSKTLLGARRVDLSGSENLIASSSEQFEAIVAEKSRVTLSAKNLEKIRAASKKHNAKLAKNHRQSKAVAHKHSRKGSTVEQSTKGKAVQTKTVASKKKSTIASNARKIQSIKTVTGKSSSKSSGAHDKLASASKKATSKTVSMLHKKQQPAKKRSHS